MSLPRQNDAGVEVDETAGRNGQLVPSRKPIDDLRVCVNAREGKTENRQGSNHSTENTELPGPDAVNLVTPAEYDELRAIPARRFDTGRLTPGGRAFPVACDLRVLHIIHGYFDECSGGAENYVRNLVATQSGVGVEVCVVTGCMQPWEACGTEETEVDGVRVVRLHRDDFFFDVHSKGYHPGVEHVLGEVLARERPDLVHVHQWIRLTSNLVEVADGLGIPAVVTLHDVYTSCPRAFRVNRDGDPCSLPLSVESCSGCVPRYGHEPEDEIAEGILLHRDHLQGELARARAVIVASQRTADVICETTGFPNGRFTLLPMGYRPRFPEPVSRTELPADGEAFRFGYWGHLTRHKGVQILLAALGQLMDVGPPRAIEVHLLGEPDTDELRDELHDLARGHPVVFHGAYDSEQLAAARLHMAVFPTLAFETFGYVLDEATELGIPAIVSDRGAIAERAGESAIAVPAGDARALAEAMRKLADRPALRDELAAKLPGLPPDFGEHATALSGIYERAIEGEPLAEAKPVPPLRRATFMMRQRETAQGHLHPDKGPA